MNGLKRLLAFALLILPIACATGCQSLGGTSLSTWWSNGLKVGPNYRQPDSKVAQAWRVNSSYANEYDDHFDQRSKPQIIKTRGDDHLAWWKNFADPKLTELIDMARRENLDLKQAGYRVLRARALRDFAVGSIFPQSQQLSGGYARSERPGVNRDAVWSQGLSVGWEFDVWGKFRRNIEAAEADLQGSHEDLRDVLICLYSDIGESYVNIRSFQRRIKAAIGNLENQKENFEKAVEIWDTGTVEEEPDPNQDRIVAYETLASIAGLEIGLVQAENKLAVLLGLTPDQVSKLVSNPEDLSFGVLPTPPTDVAIGIPANLICRRPDIRKAERELASQCSKIGIAVSDLYPSFSLIGSAGWEGVNVGDVFDARNLTGLINPGFSWNVLNYGRIRSSIEAEKARLQELCFAYEEIVLVAHQEVEDARVAYEKSFLRKEYFTAAVFHAKEAAKNVAEAADAGF